LAFDAIPRSRGHAFYDRLQQMLRQFRFDAFVETLCQPYQADKGRPSIPPGRYFRMHFVGHFEGIDSEQDIEQCWGKSLPLSVHEEVFAPPLAGLFFLVRQCA